MRSQIIAMAGFVCLATTSTALAQETTTEEKKSTSTSPKLVLGANLGISGTGLQELGPNRYNYDARPGKDAGLFARYYLGKHLALETGLNFGMGRARSESFDGSVFRPVHVKTMSFSVPLQLQYHFLSPESKIRPFIGAGVAANFMEAEINDSRGHFHNSRNSTALTLTQGITWQLNKRWQLNESLTVSREMSPFGQLQTNLRIGVAYNLFSK